MRAGRLVPLASLATLALAGGLASCARSPPGQRPSIVLVSIDTLRADRLGFAGWADAATPNLDRLAAEGVVFDHAWTTTPLTLPAHASLLTGTDPARHGVRDNGRFRLGAEHATLAEALRADGFATGAFVGAWVLHATFGLDRGFDVYDDVESGDRGQAGPTTHFAERDAAAVVDAGLAWIRTPRPQPFFAWVHVFDPHAPYRRHEGLGVRPDAHPYDAEVAHVDREIGRLLAGARHAAGPGGLLVVVTSDHGEGLGDHGESTHGLFLYESTVRVPLVVWRDRGLAAARRGDLASLVDVAPTVLAAGVPAPAAMQGRDLLAPAPPRGLHAETWYPYLAFGWSPLQAWRAGGDKLIDAPRPELFDLAADPDEGRDLAEQRPERVAALRGELDTALARLAEGAGGAEVRLLSAAEQEALQALGYVATSGGAPRGARPGDLAGLPDPKDLAPLHEALQRDVARLEAANARRDGAERAAALARLSALWDDGLRSPKLCSILATEDARSGRVDRALGVAAECAERFPDDAEILLDLGRLHVGAERWSEALPLYERAAESRPHDLGLTRDIARLQEELGEGDLALRLYLRVLEEPERDPFLAATHARAAALLLAAGRRDEALSHYLAARDSTRDPAQRAELDRLVGQIEAAGGSAGR